MIAHRLKDLKIVLTANREEQYNSIDHVLENIFDDSDEEDEEDEEDDSDDEDEDEDDEIISNNLLKEFELESAHGKRPLDGNGNGNSNDNDNRCQNKRAK